MPIRILSNSEEELALHAIQIERIVLKILTCTTIDSSLRIIIPWRLLCPKLSETVAIMMSFFSDCDAHTYLVNVDHNRRSVRIGIHTSAFIILFNTEV